MVLTLLENIFFCDVYLFRRSQSSISHQQPTDFRGFVVYHHTLRLCSVVKNEMMVSMLPTSEKEMIDGERCWGCTFKIYFFWICHEMASDLKVLAKRHLATKTWRWRNNMRKRCKWNLIFVQTVWFGVSFLLGDSSITWVRLLWTLVFNRQKFLRNQKNLSSLARWLVRFLYFTKYTHTFESILSYRKMVVW